jgi:predicted aldo/keto reductase-like oxidoreductase
MKALSGGLITKSDAAYAWFARHDNVLPIWGIQREGELDEFIRYFDDPPVMDERIAAIIEKDRSELTGSFCRSCGYCMPCPADIRIFNCARMSQLIRRAPSDSFLGDEWREAMFNIENCTGCGQCESKCPYNLDIINLLKANLADYKDILAGRVSI